MLNRRYFYAELTRIFEFENSRLLRIVLRNPACTAPSGVDFSIDYAIDGIYSALGRAARRLGSALKNRRKEASRPPKMTIESAFSGSLITSLRSRVSLPCLFLSLSLSLSFSLFFSSFFFSRSVRLKFDSFGSRARRARRAPLPLPPSPRRTPNIYVTVKLARALTERRGQLSRPLRLGS